MTEILKVETEDQVLDTIKWAVAEKKPLDVRGAGSKSVLGRPTELDHVLDLSELSGVSFYEPAELVLSAGAAIPVAEVEALVVDIVPLGMMALVRAAAVAIPTTTYGSVVHGRRT